MAFEHYHVLFLETPTHLYYIHSLGYIERYPKDKVTPQGISAVYFEKIIPHYYERFGRKHEKYVYIIVKKKRYLVKQLVARNFSNTWEQGSRILHKDGNPRNCNIENLIVNPRGFRPETCVHCQPLEVMVNDRWRQFRSIKDAAIYLHVSRSSLKRHLYGSNTHPELSILGDTPFRYIEKPRRTLP